MTSVDDGTDMTISFRTDVRLTGDMVSGDGRSVAIACGIAGGLRRRGLLVGRRGWFTSDMTDASVTEEEGDGSGGGTLPDEAWMMTKPEGVRVGSTAARRRSHRLVLLHHGEYLL